MELSLNSHSDGLEAHLIRSLVREANEEMQMKAALDDSRLAKRATSKEQEMDRKHQVLILDLSPSKNNIGRNLGNVPVSSGSNGSKVLQKLVKHNFCPESQPLRTISISEEIYYT